MKYTLVENLTTIEYSSLVEAVRMSEQTRDFGFAISAFKPIWNDIELDPDFSSFSIYQQAELYRLAGYFTSNYGHHKNLKNYQERAKNLLTKSILLFESLGENLKIADAQSALAMCYIFEGAFPEAESILEQTAQDFLENQLNLIYLQNRGNLILAKIYQKKYQEALSIIESIEIPMEFCDDLKTKSVFHEKAGLIYRATCQFDKAIWHYNKSIEFAKVINNHTYLSSAKNNLAFLYNKISNFELAHRNINEAIEIVRQNNKIGWLAHYLDTKAVIYAKEGHLELALETINNAISIFRKGEDANGLTESIWNKCKFLLNLDRKEEAITLFGELIPIASQQMGEFAVKFFVKEFSNLIHIKHNGSLEEEVIRFKRIEIVNAIRQSKFNLYDAAELLKIQPQVLIKTIDKEFPELYQELDILQQPNFDENLGHVSRKNKTSAPRNISEISLNDIEIKFEGEAPRNPKTFYFSAEKMVEAFGISQDAIVCIIPAHQFIPDEFVLIEDPSKNIYTFGKVNYDKDLDLYFFLSEDEPIPISLEEIKLIGKAIGYCPFDEIQEDKIFIRSF